MYKLVLIGHDYTNVGGEYKRIDTRHNFKCVSCNELCELIGRMAEASDDTLELTITWEEDNND